MAIEYGMRTLNSVYRKDWDAAIHNFFEHMAQHEETAPLFFEMVSSGFGVFYKDYRKPLWDVLFLPQSPLRFRHLQHIRSHIELSRIDEAWKYLEPLKIGEFAGVEKVQDTVFERYLAAFILALSGHIVDFRKRIWRH